MAVGNKITNDHKLGFKEEISKSAGDSKEKFFSFFNDGKGIENIFLRGFWDFSYHMVSPMIPYIKSPENMTVLEIGYGGGRLLSAAAHFFKNAIGVDIHDNNQTVKEEFSNRKIENINLHQIINNEYPILDKSIDFAYSFIVFQHMQTVEVVENNLKELYRVLKPGSYAIIYVGRFAKNSQYTKSKYKLFLDFIIENFRLPKGFIEMPAKVNEVNLIFTRRFAKHLFNKHGFKIVKITISKRKIPDGVMEYGGQYGFILKKPI